MSYRQFLLGNFGAAAVWAATIVSLAFFSGKLVSLEQIVVWTAQIGVALLFFGRCVITRPDSLGIWAEENENYF